MMAIGLFYLLLMLGVICILGAVFFLIGALIEFFDSFGETDRSFMRSLLIVALVLFGLGILGPLVAHESGYLSYEDDRIWCRDDLTNTRCYERETGRQTCSITADSQFIMRCGPQPAQGLSE